MKKFTHSLSVVMPAYNEEKRIVFLDVGAVAISHTNSTGSTKVLPLILEKIQIFSPKYNTLFLMLIRLFFPIFLRNVLLWEFFLFHCLERWAKNVFFVCNKGSE